MNKLNQTLAIEKGVKSRVYSEFTELHKASQKAELFNGFAKTYRKKDEDGEDYPPERKRVQFSVGNVLQRASVLLTQLFDVTATKDFANCFATADVVVDGQVLIKAAPATYLLFLEKQIVDLHTFIEKLPVLDEAEDWSRDENSGLFKTSPTATHRTKKVQRPIVLYDATDKHPAQTQLLTEDIVVGYWDTIKYSGALPAPRKTELLQRIDSLGQAVKKAREVANSVDAPEQSVGAPVFDYLFA